MKIKQKRNCKNCGEILCGQWIRKVTGRIKRFVTYTCECGELIDKKTHE